MHLSLIFSALLLATVAKAAPESQIELPGDEMAIDYDKFNELIESFDADEENGEGKQLGRKLLSELRRVEKTAIQLIEKFLANRAGKDDGEDDEKQILQTLKKAYEITNDKISNLVADNANGDDDENSAGNQILAVLKKANEIAHDRIKKLVAKYGSEADEDKTGTVRRILSAIMKIDKEAYNRMKKLIASFKGKASGNNDGKGKQIIDALEKVNDAAQNKVKKIIGKSESDDNEEKPMGKGKQILEKLSDGKKAVENKVKNAAVKPEAHANQRRDVNDILRYPIQIVHDIQDMF